MKQPIPSVGKTYMFYDDGKVTYSRQYEARVTEIISPDMAKQVKFNLVDYQDWDGDSHKYLTEIPYTTTLWNLFQVEAEECDWLFNGETDYFVKASIPKYDENDIWFVRTKDGGWFSLDIQSSWQGGRLDVDGSLTRDLDEIYKDLENDKK